MLRAFSESDQITGFSFAHFVIYFSKLDNDAHFAYGFTARIASKHDSGAESRNMNLTE